MQHSSDIRQQNTASVSLIFHKKLNITITNKQSINSNNKAQYTEANPKQRKAKQIMSLSLLTRHNVMTMARHQRQCIIGNTSTRITQRGVSTQGQEAVCRLKEALEHYRIQK